MPINHRQFEEACARLYIEFFENFPNGDLRDRVVNILSHGNYSLYEPREMLEENKDYFRRILHDFIERYPFNPALFPSEPAERPTP